MHIPLEVKPKHRIQSTSFPCTMFNCRKELLSTLKLEVGFYNIFTISATTKTNLYSDINVLGDFVVFFGVFFFFFVFSFLFNYSHHQKSLFTNVNFILANKNKGTWPWTTPDDFLSWTPIDSFSNRNQWGDGVGGVGGGSDYASL